jgi:hypothetical protein
MALIAPVLKWIVYPAMMRAVKRRWEQSFPAGGRSPLAPHSQQMP